MINSEDYNPPNRCHMALVPCLPDVGQRVAGHVGGGVGGVGWVERGKNDGSADRHFHWLS